MSNDDNDHNVHGPVVVVEPRVGDSRTGLAVLCRRYGNPPDDSRREAGGFDGGELND